jgi:hypothetical protein
MKIRFAALCVALLMGVIPQALYAQGPPPGQPYIQVAMPGFGPQPPSEQEYGRETVGALRAPQGPRARYSGAVGLRALLW